MKKALLILLAFPFIATQCREKEGPECHYDIKVQNTSGKDIILARNGNDAQGNCVASYVATIATGTVYAYNSYDCWEYHMTSDSKQEIYLLEAGATNADTVVHCDTLIKYNKILRKVSLNTDELKNNYFVIAYP